MNLKIRVVSWLDGELVGFQRLKKMIRMQGFISVVIYTVHLAN